MTRVTDTISPCAIKAREPPVIRQLNVAANTSIGGLQVRAPDHISLRAVAPRAGDRKVSDAGPSAIAMQGAC
ncbi:MAG: hypothetical protein AMXMBFR37_01310 [Steroidobacteraceae bacterium]